MEIVDVTTVVDASFVESLKKIIKDPEKDDYKHENYKECKDHAEEMSWHVYGTKPERLLKRTRPREDPAITTYRIESYEPITQSVCKKALAIVHKIFDPNLYSIRFEQSKQAEELKKYTLEDYPQFNTIVNYLANYILKKMVADPNAIILVQPLRYDILGSERVQPIASCYHSRDIFMRGMDYVLLFDKLVSTEKGAKRWYFTYADTVGIYHFFVELSADGRDYLFTTLASYVHNFGELPVWSLTGDYSDSKIGCYQSYFYAAVPFWNEAINDHSDVTGAYRMHMWPQKWEVADECEYVERTEGGNYPCNGGYIFNGQDKYKCPGCNGSGYKTAKSPYESHLVNRDKFLNAEGGAGNIQPPFGYVTVPVEATKMLEDKADKNLMKGLEALSMDVVNEIGLNQSGKAKEMDRTELNDFLKRISSVMFDTHMTNIYYFFTRYMFGVSDPEKVETIQPEISKPTQFDVYSSTELTEQFAKSKEAKLNPSYLAVKQVEIQNKEFSTHPQLLARLNLEISLDPLAEVSTDEISLMLTNGTIEQTTAIIHDNIRLFVAQAIEENKGFEELERMKQWEILKEYAEEVIEANKVKIDESMIEPKDTGEEEPKEPEEVNQE
jgi:hypothetical protein